MTGMTPSVGRIVHYVARGSADGVYPKMCRAATVAQVGAWMQVPLSQSDEVVHDDGRRFRTVEQEWQPEACALVVTNPTGLFFNTCPRDEDGKAGGTWHQPERVDSP